MQSNAPADKCCQMPPRMNSFKCTRAGGRQKVRTGRKIVEKSRPLGKLAPHAPLRAGHQNEVSPISLLCYAFLCYALLCFAMLCFAMLCCCFSCSLFFMFNVFSFSLLFPFHFCSLFFFVHCLLLIAWSHWIALDSFAWTYWTSSHSLHGLRWHELTRHKPALSSHSQPTPPHSSYNIVQ